MSSGRVLLAIARHTTSQLLVLRQWLRSIQLVTLHPAHQMNVVVRHSFRLLSRGAPSTAVCSMLSSLVC